MQIVRHLSPSSHPEALLNSNNDFPSEIYYSHRVRLRLPSPSSTKFLNYSTAVGYRGGGIGGLAFAVALAKTGVEFNVDIYESTTNFGDIGAGIGIWPRIWKCLVGLGLEEDLKSKFTDMGTGEVYENEIVVCRRLKDHVEGKMSYYKADQAEGINCGQAQRMSNILIHFPTHC